MEKNWCVLAWSLGNLDPGLCQNVQSVLGLSLVEVTAMVWWTSDSGNKLKNVENGHSFFENPYFCTFENSNKMCCNLGSVEFSNR